MAVSRQVDCHQTQTAIVVWSHPISTNWCFDEPQNVRNLFAPLADILGVDNWNEAYPQAVGDRWHTDVMDDPKLLFAMEREKGQSQGYFFCRGRSSRDMGQFFSNCNGTQAT
eukprot:scaffold35187_cov39-Attheya_sp.AAC.2